MDIKFDTAWEVAMLWDGDYQMKLRQAQRLAEKSRVISSFLSVMHADIWKVNAAYAVLRLCPEYTCAQILAEVFEMPLNLVDDMLCEMMKIEEEEREE